MKKLWKPLIASALIGGLCLSAFAAPDVAYAKTHRKTIHYELDSDDTETWFEIEPDSVSVFDMHGIHYVSFWMAEIYSGGDLSAVIPFGGLIKDKHNWGSYHCLVKLNEDGSYQADGIFFNEKTAKDKDSIDLLANWEKELTKKYSRDNDSTRQLQFNDMDIFNPKEWHDPKGLHGLGDEYTLLHHALDKSVGYLRNNNPDIVQQVIALNRRDEADVLAQHEAEAQKKREDFRNSRAAEASQNHSQLLSDYKAETSRDVYGVLNGLGDYSWDMFLNSVAPRPNMDINKLIHNLWTLDYVGYNYGRIGPDGTVRNKDSEFQEIVRFMPVFFVNSETSEFIWDSSFLEISALYRTGGVQLPSGATKHETFEGELYYGSHPNFWGSSTIPEAKTPDAGGEKKIYFNPNAPGNFKTVNGSPMCYRWEPGASDDEFWLMEYFLNDQPTGWGYHLMRVK